jgi:hypothetical protein
VTVRTPPPYKPDVDEANLKAAVHAALRGRGIENRRIDRHIWNVDRAVITNPTNTARVVDGGKEGQNISRHRAGMADDQVFYTFTLETAPRLRIRDLQTWAKSGGVVPTIVAVFNWILDHKSIIMGFVPILSGSSLDSIVDGLRANEDWLSESNQMLDGTWESEAAFIVHHISAAFLALELQSQ